MKYDLRTSYKNHQLTGKQLKEIDNRRLYALKANDYSDIMDAKHKVIKIIDEKGLDSDDNKTSLDAAFKVLPYIMPQKKAIEVNVIHRKLEDIISESIEEAEIIDIPAVSVKSDAHISDIRQDNKQGNDNV